MRTLLIWDLIRGFVAVSLPEIIFGHICIKKCWQVATWFSTKLASLNLSGLFSLFITASFSLDVRKKNLKKLFLIIFLS